MKKILLSMVAAVAMLATSCVTDATNDLAVGNESVVSFSVESQNASRATTAIADGTKATRLQYAVFSADEDGTPITYLEDLSSEVKGTVELKNLKASFDLTLLNQNYYTIVFWADAQSSIYTFDAERATVTATYKDAEGNSRVNANDDTLDAFYAVVPFRVNGTTVVEAKLKRPFAQVNFATNDIAAAATAGFDTENLHSTFTAHIYNSLNLVSGKLDGEDTVTFKLNGVPSEDETCKAGYRWVAMNYVFASENEGSLNTCELTITDENNKSVSISYPQAPVKRNWKTNLIGALLTGSTSVDVEILPDFNQPDIDKEISVTYNGVNYETVTDAIDAAVADTENDSPIITVSGEVEAPASSTIVPAGKNLTLDMKEGAKMTFTGGDVVSRAAASNQIVFDVRGEMTINGGTIEYVYQGENMGWNAMTTIFNVTAGGVLNLNGVTAKNLGGTDMGFVAHLNNWGTVTLNAENCTLESNYVPVRVFNSGPDMNNVDIKNSTLKGVSAAFWVHNYTVADFGTEAKAEAQKALLNLAIYNQDNTFSPDINGIRYGFTNSIRTDAYGITKSVSEDGTIVTLGSVVENGLVRRGVAGAEKNSTIKSVILNDGITELPNRTFYRYFALETVELPSTLTVLGAAGDATTNGNVFQGCVALKNIVIPESVTTMGPGAFYGCTALETVNIPSRVTRIEKDTFRETGIKKIEFHEGVTYIGQWAFRDCKVLEQIVINAPSFTVEADTFTNMARPYPNFTIYVANADMKTYLEGMLDAEEKKYITVVAPATFAQENLPKVEGTETYNTIFSENTNFASNITLAADQTNANSGYGATGVAVTNGAVLNGQGHTLKVTKAGGTWDCAINAQSGTIKNMTVSGAMRGIFMGGANGDVYIDNVVFSGVIYTFNSDGGNKDFGVYISNCTINGWTSHSDVHKEVVYTNCSFGEGSGYAFCRPYGPTVFENCEFSQDFGFDTQKSSSIVFKNCTHNGVKITAENAATLGGVDKNGNAVTFLYNGINSLVIE